VASPSQWVAGARPRTLPNSIVPVLVGTGVAIGFGHAIWWRAAVALLVSMLLQIGVNYANDYSDGIRGTDEERVGPLRLVGSKVAPPKQVLAAAAGCFLLAAVAGLVLAAVTT
jgi:1,4-dihydroxy-2-naphthoate octaprenyltransferase